MEDFSVQSFFSIDEYAHRSLFEGCVYAWEPLTRLVSYLKKEKLGKIDVDIPQGVHLVDPSLISIGPGTIIEPGAYIQGPCIIGANCIIRHGAYVRGDIITGDGCIIGHATEVKHTIFLNNAFAPHFNYVGDSILGNRVNLGAGVVCANLRLDRSFVNVGWSGKKINTNLEKLGAIIGDEAQLGCHCVTNPGTFIGKSALCHPCLNVHGYIPPHAKVKRPYKNLVEV
jgi:UDP-N-acetylglucosamine diphosphorylase / glucose-1-phosphate thymidylyltransferase / UDP-N-acetylgalactosamine diphosphorylase / glucosamine-1-phosphate N-acetyltransferase / galactosamine-1-phosphate N-acetyltransferase